MDYDIGSPANDRIKRLVRLRKRRQRDAEQLFPVEERRVISRAMAAGHEPAEVYWCPDLIEKPFLGESDVTTVSPEALARAAYRSNPEGMVALFPYLPLEISGITTTTESLVLVVEGVEKPGNLGALLRIADAANLDAVLIVGEETDPFNPNVVRSSTGALFSVPLARVDFGVLLQWLSSHRIRSAAAVAGDGEAMWDADLAGPLALWIGSEAEGLSDGAVEAADQIVSIPMYGQVDSLNASVSGAILVFEALRQRVSAGAR